MGIPKHSGINFSSPGTTLNDFMNQLGMHEHQIELAKQYMLTDAKLTLSTPKKPKPMFPAIPTSFANLTQVSLAPVGSTPGDVFEWQHVGYTSGQEPPDMDDEDYEEDFEPFDEDDVDDAFDNLDDEAVALTSKAKTGTQAPSWTSVNDIGIGKSHLHLNNYVSGSITTNTFSKAQGFETLLPSEMDLAGRLRAARELLDNLMLMAEESIDMKLGTLSAAYVRSLAEEIEKTLRGVDS